MAAFTDIERDRWWARAICDVEEALGTDGRAGLSPVESARRLARDGPNEIDEEAPPSAGAMVVRQLTGAVVLVLIAAAVVAALIGDLKDAAVIAAVIVVDTAVGLVQERRAARAVRALRSLSAPFARVVREGVTTTIAASEIVAGDVILVEPGDIVPADARLVEAPNLQVNESSLTGESVAVTKEIDPLDLSGDPGLGDRRNMVFKGTEVTYGRGRALVTATGMNTALGQVALLLEAHRAPDTPLQRRLGVLGRQLSIATIAVCAVVFAIGVASGESASRMVLASVSLAVAAIPEALPAVVTISLALGAQRMARLHAIIRKLPAVETLGSVTVIASDKTGTLTEGRMVVERVWSVDGVEYEVEGTGYEPAGAVRAAGGSGRDTESLERLVTAATLCNDAALIAPRHAGTPWEVAGDPTEGALLVFGARAGVDADAIRQRFPRVAEEPFDAQRKTMTTVHAGADGTFLACAKGAIEVLSHDTTAHEVAQHYAETGYRVLAISSGVFTSHDDATRAAAADLELLGILAIADPPRPEAAAAVAAARAAGIETVMITGDHPSTARAIAGRLGILDGRAVVTGDELALLDRRELTAAVDRIAVYARTTPEQKLAIVQSLGDAGHIVAMTGDGVNDAPALRAADIGVAMGKHGTDVAKEAADMVLADDDFATIVVATREGRRIYDNIRRFVRYGLTGGSAEVWVMFAAPFLGLPLPLVPVQILWLNLLTHGLPGLALGVEPPDPDSMRRPPRRPDENILGAGLWQHVLRFGLLTGAVALAIALVGRAQDWPWQTMLLSTLVGLQLGNALAVRSETRSLRTLGVTTNRFLWLAVVGTAAAQLLAIYWAPLQQALETDALAIQELLLVALATPATLVAIECEKWRRRRRQAMLR
jgi:Ca2+-transporting ATPase